MPISRYARSVHGSVLSVLVLWLVCPSRVSAGPQEGSDFSNDLFTDLAPLLALFGERVTMQFLSQATGWADCVILAMAPLGIVTIIVSAIRVGGPGWLKAVIGRARENLVTAELELMSSTSQEACELWNGQTVVRCQGSAPIWEFVCVLPRVQVASSHENDRENLPVVRVMSLEEAMERGVIQYKKGSQSRSRAKAALDFMYSGLQSVFSWILAKSVQVTRFGRGETLADEENSGPVKTEVLRKPTISQDELSSKEQPSGLKPNEIAVIRNLRSAPPNITLNSHADFRRTELYFVACFGVLLQLCVVIYSGFITLYPTMLPKMDEESTDIERYAFPMAASGTLVLVCGILLCGHVVESSTVEESYELSDELSTYKDIHILWMQQENKVSDQFFDSCAIYSKEARNSFSTSSRAFQAHETPSFSSSPSLEKVSKPSYNSSKNSRDPAREDSRWLMEGATVLGVVISLSGFVAQFTGFRGLHWTVSVANLGAVVVMTALRAFVRRSLIERLGTSRLTPRFELDWLAQTLSKYGGSSQYPQKPTQTSQLVFGEGRVEPENIDSSATVPIEFNVLTDHDNPMGDRIPRDRDWGAEITSALGLLVLRRDLGRLADWRGPAALEAKRVAEAIELVMNAFHPPDPNDPFSTYWVLEVQRGQAESEFVHIGLSGEDGTWHIRADELEAVLSLWLYSASELGSVADNNSTQKDSWLRGQDPQSKPVLRLLGPSTSGMIQDLKWWMPDEFVGIFEVEEEHKASLFDKSQRIHLDRTRIANSGRRPATDAEESDLAADNVPQVAMSRWKVSPARDLGNKGDHKPKRDPVTASEIAPKSFIATISRDPLAKLYAQDLFSAFIWMLARDGVYYKEIPVFEDAIIRPGNTTGLEAWKHFTLRSERLAKLAHDIHTTGLGSLDEIYQSIIPALSFNNKLPRLDVVVELARDQGAICEQSRRWKEAMETYRWLFEAASQYNSSSFIYKKALAVLLSFRRRLAYQHQLDAEYDVFGSTGVGEAKEAVDHLIQSADPGALRILTEWPVLSDRSTSTHFPVKDDQAVVNYKGLSDMSLDLKREIEFRQKLGKSLSPELNKDAKDVFDSRPLHHAASEPNGFFSDLLHRSPGEELWGMSDYEDSFAERKLLHWTMQHSMSSITPRLCLLELLEEGADPNVRDIHGWTPLHYACISSCNDETKAKVSLLLQYHAQVDVQGIDGIAPIHCASISGGINLLEMLHSKGANINCTDVMGRTPLHYAAIHGRVDVLRYLKQNGADKTQRDQYGRVAHHFAARCGQASIFFELRDIEPGACNVLGWKVVHYAAFHGQYNVVREHCGKIPACSVADLAGRTPLHLAARNGHDPIVEYLMSYNDRPVPDSEGYTPLHIACLFGHVTTVRLLLSLPKDPSLERDDVGCRSSLLYSKAGEIPQTAFQIAAQAGHAEVLKALISISHELGTYEKMMDHSGMGVGFPLLNIAAASSTAPVIDVLSQAGADINPPVAAGVTPLILAARSGNEQTTRRLLELGADPTKEDHEGSTALQNAIKFGNVNVVATFIELLPESGPEHLGDLLHCAIHDDQPNVVDLLLREGANINREDQEKRTPLHKAAAGASVDIVAQLTRRGADVTATDLQGRTALFAAVEAQKNTSTECMEIMIEHGFDVNWQDTSGTAPLHLAAAAGDRKILECLIQGGADVEMKTLQGRTPLHAAFELGQVSTARSLVDKGARNDTIDSDGVTPLGLAVLTLSEQPHKKIYKLMYFGKRPLRTRDGKGRLPVHLAASHGDSLTISLLLERDCIEETDDRGRTILHHAVLSGRMENFRTVLSAGACVNVADYDGVTALALAVQRGEEEMVSTLIERGADVSAQGPKGLSPLHLAVELGQQDTAVRAGKAACVGTLVSHGAHLEARDIRQRTPLMVAVEVDNVKAVEKLVGSGADTTVRNPRGQTLLQVAREGGNDDIVNALEGRAKSGPEDSTT